MKRVVEEYSSFVNDNRIQSYFVDIENHVLEFKTVYYDYARITITFEGVLSHKFEHVIQDNIIFGMEQISIEYYIEKNKKGKIIWYMNCKKDFFMDINLSPF